MSLIAPFYVAAGFALYLTRRTELEAWDIELAFRRLISRKQSSREALPARPAGRAGRALSLLLCGTLLAGGHVSELPAAALESREAKTVMAQVLADEAFGQRKQETYWKYIGAAQQPAADREELHWLVKWLLGVLEGFTRGSAAFGKGVLLIGAGVLLAWLLYKAWANREHLVTRRPHSARRRQPASLFGLSLDSQSLPADITGECRRLLRQGEIRAALSLLYRGVLVALLRHERLEIADSATEGECVAQVRAVCPEGESAFFVRLTRVWIAAAYGHQPPDARQVAGLCDEWQRLFGGEPGHG
jgi:hypothetical protein